MKKKFAVIMVNYNSFNDTKEIISDLNKFDKKIFDIFLVDNHSSKEDSDKLSKYAKENKIILTKLSENLGFAGGNNVAIKMALANEYDYIFLLNPDTLIKDKDFFKIIEREMKESHADIIGPLIKYYPEKEKIYFAGGFISNITGMTVMKGKKELDHGQYKDNIKCDFITGCAIIIKKEVFDKIGLIPEDYFLYFEEADFCMKAKNNGFNVVFTPKTTVYHKVSSAIGYLSNTYLYYMIRNQRIFSKKYISWKCKPLFWVWYLSFWCGGYFILSLKYKNYQGYKQILRGLMNGSKI